MSPSPSYPGVYVGEVASGVRTIVGVPTSICVFMGRAHDGPLAGEGVAPTPVFSFADYQRIFGGIQDATPMRQAVLDFFANGGTQALIVRVRRPEDVIEPQDAGDAQVEGPGAPLDDDDYLGVGLDALRRSDLFNLLCIPPDLPEGDTSPAVYRAALALCVERRAMLLVDPPIAWDSASAVTTGDGDALRALGLSHEDGRNAALYFPRLCHSGQGGQMGGLTRVACGAVAGVIARIDATRGVWKAPAGLEATLKGVDGLPILLTDAQNGLLNPLGVNCLRRFPGAGDVVFGARTLRGADRFGDEYKHVPVRRLALYLQESIERGVAWAAWEPNVEALWAQMRLNIDAFLQGLFRQGAFQGRQAGDAYFVKCDAQTTTQQDIDRGVCNIVVGFAPLKPAEFVVLKLSVSAGSA